MLHISDNRNTNRRWLQTLCEGNWAALSRGTKIKFTSWFSLLKKSFYTYIFYVQLLIMCTTLDLLTKCFLFMLFVQTGNQHIYQPVGKQGKRHNSKVQLQPYNCWCFIPLYNKLQNTLPLWTQSLQTYSLYPKCSYSVCLQISGFLSQAFYLYSVKRHNFEIFSPFFL